MQICEALHIVLFAYAANNPVHYTDPDGTIAISGTILLAAAVATASTISVAYISKELSKGITNVVTDVQTAIQEKKETKIYMTYTMTNSEGVVYSGRTSGYGNPADILKKRHINHHMAKLGFSNVKPDQIAYGEQGKLAIRGREQQLIDKNGGAKMDTINGKPGTSGNTIRGVSKLNPKGPIYHEAANKTFGNIAPYTGFGSIQE